MQNVVIQPSALIGVPVTDGWYLFDQHCDGETHIVRWHPPTNTFRFDALAGSRNARDVFTQMSGKDMCHCGVLWRFFERCPRYNHFTLGHGILSHPAGPIGLFIAMVTN